MTEFELREKIAYQLAKSKVGKKSEELRRVVVISENRLREELKSMISLGYVLKTGVTASTRYELTAQGRLMFISGNESALKQIENEPVLTEESSNDAEKSPLTQNEKQEIKMHESPKLSDIISADNFAPMAASSDELNIGHDEDAGAHYRFQYKGINLDPFRIAQIYDMDDFCMMTILKKTLCAGRRGHKDFEQDLKDIICAAQRKLEMLCEDNARR